MAFRVRLSDDYGTYTTFKISRRDTTKYPYALLVKSLDDIIEFFNYNKQDLLYSTRLSKLIDSTVIIDQGRPLPVSIMMFDEYEKTPEGFESTLATKTSEYNSYYQRVQNGKLPVEVAQNIQLEELEPIKLRQHNRKGEILTIGIYSERGFKYNYHETGLSIRILDSDRNLLHKAKQNNRNFVFSHLNTNSNPIVEFNYDLYKAEIHLDDLRTHRFVFFLEHGFAFIK